MIYLASPYTHPWPEVVEARVTHTAKFLLRHLKQRKPIFSPIVYCHDLATVHHLPTDANHWWEFNRVFLDRASELWVLHLKDWEKAKGVRQEIDYWLELNPESLAIMYDQEGYHWTAYTKTG